MSKPIKSESGIIDKYIGDAIMAFWTEPFCNKKNESILACKAALNSIKEINEFNKDFKKIAANKHFTTIQIRIGLASGTATVGSIGSESTRSFTVMGNTVNIGARLETTNKLYGTTILVCEQTKSNSEKLFTFREIDTVLLAGKNAINHLRINRFNKQHHH